MQLRHYYRRQSLCFLIIIPSLICWCSPRIQAQQQQQRRRRRRNSAPEHFQNDPKHENDGRQQPQGETPLGKQWIEYIRMQNQQHQRPSDDNNSNNDVARLFWQHKMSRPKHVLEGFKNTLLVSLPLALLGTVSFVGLPLWSGYQSFLSADTYAAETVLSIIAASLAGGLLSSTCWITSFSFGVWQLVVGLIYTPRALWARLQGRTYFQRDKRKWKHYNLTEHMNELSSASFNNGIVQDNSLYEILDIEPTATAKEIKRAYYQLAKVYHPDKNPNHQEQFLKLHSAYSILSDPKSRRDYDIMGIKAVDNASSFDAGIFFDVLFGVSPELEHYIGDLDVKSIASRLVDVAIMATQENPERRNDIFQQFISSFSEETSHRRESRQVDVARYLQDFVRDYAIRRDMTETEFQYKCVEEAKRVTASTPFGYQFVASIGTALYWQGFSSLHSPMGLPMYLASLTRSTYTGIARWTSMIQGFVQLAKGCEEVVTRVSEDAIQENPSVTKDEVKQRIQTELLKDMGSSLMTLVWQYNQWDITSTTEEAYWKVMHDTGSGKLSWRQKSRQSRALRILGHSFLQQADKTASHNKERTTESFLDIQARVQIALEMATASKDEKQRKRKDTR
jgi:curved DNA-binding protein CbpA